MSLPKKITVKCSKCGAEIEATIFESINTDYATDIVDKITSGDIFNVKCTKCGFVSQLEYDFLYHDIKHGAMIWVLHENSAEYEKKISELKHSENILQYKTTRIVNSINTLREKITCLENNRDDKIIELCKVFIKYNLLSKQPDFDFDYAFYTTFLDKERVFLYDKSGEELSCELTEEAYSLLYDLYYNSKYASIFEDYYAIVDHDWAEETLYPLLKQESDRIDAKNAAESAKATNTPSTEKKLTCPKCKQELPEDSVFCHYCGTSVNIQQKTTSIQTSISKINILNSDSSISDKQRKAKNAMQTNSKKSWKYVLVISIVVLIITIGTILLMPEIKYQQACRKLNNGSYTDAAEIFKELNGYRDSNDKVEEVKYQQACSKLENGSYSAAVDLFEILDGYKDSENKINTAKYQYVLKHKNNDDRTTFSYLKDLKKQDYKDSTNIYNDLYEWEITVVAINSSKNDETTYKSYISKYSAVYFHLELSGGEPGESVRITAEPVFPSGEIGEYVFEDKWSDGDSLWYGWSDSIYNTPKYGDTGTLRCNFYDDEENLIGVGSVTITE